MNLDNKYLSMGVVVLATIAAQFPALGHWITAETDKSEHLVTIVEGIVGVLLLIWGGAKGKGMVPEVKK